MIKPQTKLVSDLPKRVAAVVGLMLERAGVEDVELSDTLFTSPETDDVGQIAADFAKLIREKPPETQYALYAEILGTPQTGPRQIRTILVDRDGKVILAARDDEKTYADTGKVRPKDPMTCSLFVANKLRKQWNLADPLRKDAPQGKMARHWDEEAGLPPKAEIAAIKGRMETLLKNRATSRFVVYPVRIGTAADKQCAVKLAAMLSEQDICRAVAADLDPKLQIPGNPNEQKVLWDTARAFRRFVRENPPREDYAVYADYGIGRSAAGKMKVGHVHVIVCDRAGEWVLLDYENSHHADFQAIGPESPDDCNRLVVRRAQGAIAQQ
ncbi:MAG: hypothetical protein JXB62_10010 [Pirellulales bacterium]|nr:hypothetical protein [Pirellulales bacterium]